MSDEEPAVVVKDLYKTFKLPHEQHSGIKQATLNIFKRGKHGHETQKVLNDISFEIKKGEFFGIVGRNGSGKSTLLKLLAGIYAPDKGLIQVNGSLTPFIELGVGFNHELTGRENVFMNGALLGFDRKQMQSMYDDIVSFAELENFMDQKLKNYSSGMQVRLAFSIATRANSDVLIFDEVLAVGDARFQQKCLDVFRQLKQDGKTIILVSHSTGDIEKFCDRVLVLEKSKSLGVYNPQKAVALYESINIDESNDKTTAEQTKRWGSRKLTISNVTVTPEQVTISQNLRITVEIKAGKAKLDKDLPFIVGLGVHDSEKINIAGPNSKEQKFVFKKDRESASVTFSIPAISFNSGDYALTVAVLDEFAERSYDHIIDVKKFHVLSDKLHYGKLVINDAVWSIK